MTPEQPHVVVIDDDPTIAWNIRELMPHWHIQDANNGVDGLALVRAAPDSLDLVVLDTMMPHDGIMVASQVRFAYPKLKILPFTADETVLPWFNELGCLPALVKPMHPTDLAQHLQAALGCEMPATTRNALLPYLLRRASASEQQIAAEQGSGLRTVVLGVSYPLCEVLSRRISLAGGKIRAAVNSPSMLRSILRNIRISLLVTDCTTHIMGAEIAREFNLPMMVMAQTLSAAYRVREEVAGVVVEPVCTATLAEALLSVAEGRRYRDSKLDMPIAHGLLTRVEYDLLIRLLQGYRPNEIALALNIRPDTVNRHRVNIYEKLQVEDLDDVRRLIDTRWALQPG